MQSLGTIAAMAVLASVLLSSCTDNMLVRHVVSVRSGDPLSLKDLHDFGAHSPHVFLHGLNRLGTFELIILQ